MSDKEEEESRRVYKREREVATAVYKNVQMTRGGGNREPDDPYSMSVSSMNCLEEVVLVALLGFAMFSDWSFSTF